MQDDLDKREADLKHKGDVLAQNTNEEKSYVDGMIDTKTKQKDESFSKRESGIEDREKDVVNTERMIEANTEDSKKTSAELQNAKRSQDEIVEKLKAKEADVLRKVEETARKEKFLLDKENAVKEKGQYITKKEADIAKKELFRQEEILDGEEVVVGGKDVVYDLQSGSEFNLLPGFDDGNQIGCVEGCGNDSILF